MKTKTILLCFFTFVAVMFIAVYPVYSTIKLNPVREVVDGEGYTYRLVREAEQLEDHKMKCAIWERVIEDKYYVYSPSLDWIKHPTNTPSFLMFNR